MHFSNSSQLYQVSYSKNTVYQACQGRKRQAKGHHSPSSIQGKRLAIDDQKNNILASLCLASYLAANWLQKLETKHCVYYAEVISVLVCVCAYVCVCVHMCVCVCVCVCVCMCMCV